MLLQDVDPNWTGSTPMMIWRHCFSSV